MWWNNIKEIKEWLCTITDRLIQIEGELIEIENDFTNPSI